MIEVRNLTKRFGPKTAVDNISFDVQKGQVLGFLGPNGAGKSTTMRMITGYISATEGSIVVGGIDMLAEPIKAKAKVGYLPESAPLYSDMSVESFLRFCGELRGLSGSVRNKAADKAIETCFLENVRRQSIDTLSKGYRHRTCLAQSILHDPEILVMDEPTDGLDPNQKREVRNLIKRMATEKTIIFSTHILEEVEAVCSRAIIIDKGRIVADGAPDELKRQDSAAGIVTVTVNGLAGEAIKSELERLPHASSVEAITMTGTSFTGRISPKNRTNPGTLAAEVFHLCSGKNLVLIDLSTEPGRLDGMFREITAQDRN